MKNNEIGDCALAAPGHMIMEWTASAGAEIVPHDDDIVAAYSAVTGYNPADPTTDQGSNELDVLKYWRSTGIAGHKIDAFASVRPRNIEHVKQAIYLFGGAYIGLALPQTAMYQRTWDVVGGFKHLLHDTFGVGPSPEPNSWGGHAVNLIGYDEDGLYCVTWGEIVKMTWRFFARYADECWACVSRDFFNTDGIARTGFQFQAMLDDVKFVTG